MEKISKGQSIVQLYYEELETIPTTTVGSSSGDVHRAFSRRMDSNEQSNYLFDQYGNALQEQLKSNASQYVLSSLNGNSSQQKLVKKVDSEYMLRELRNQSEQNQSFSRDAPTRPFLIGTPVNAKDVRAQIESFDNAIVIPQIIDGKVYFTTHTEADTRTAIEGSASNPNLNEATTGTAVGVDLHKVKFSFAQLVQLLGASTCQRLEREFVRQNQLSEAELAQLRTAREALSSASPRTAQSPEPNLLSIRTANSLEPNLLSVYSARSPGNFTNNDGITTAQSPEPNLLSTRTANSREPNLLSVYSARSPGNFTRNEGVTTAQSPEPNLLSTRTANSLEPNLLSVYSARSPGMLTAREPNSLLTAPSSSSTRSLLDGESPDVWTARSFATPSGSTQSVLTAQEIESLRSSQDVQTAVEILSEMSRSSQDVTTALEIQDSATQMTI